MNNIYTPETYQYSNLYEYKSSRRHNIEYINCPCALDIETTSHYCTKLEKNCEKMKRGECVREKCSDWITPKSHIYIFQVAIENDCIIGRTYEELSNLFQKMMETLSLSKSRRVVIYVHNLSYEFQFLSSYFNFSELFATKKRKPIKLLLSDYGIELRCSYILSNMSLAKFLENTPGVINQKKIGYLDYSKKRYSDTTLTQEELEYCINDVLGLSQAIKYLLQHDTLASIPLTSTGFVRRECREAVKMNPKNIKRFRNEKLTYDQYSQLKTIFRGGNCASSYLKVGEICKNVQSYDMTSAYPFVMMTEKFPGKFIRVSSSELKKYESPEYSFFATAKFMNIKLIPEISPIGYIPVSKCYYKNANRYNGRILSADEVIMQLTNIDLQIIQQTYQYESIEYADVHVAKNSYLPEELLKKIYEFFYKKCTLKGICDKEYEYMKSKNKLNGIYGMIVTDVTQETIYYSDDWHREYENISKEEVESIKNEHLKKYYANKNSFLSYQHGVWVPAYCRRNLQEAINICGTDLIYCDTDSIKTTKEIETQIQALNNKFLEKIEHSPIAPIVTINSKQHIMGLWEKDALYSEFITLGAKKYAYRSLDGKLHTTVSGLGKKEGEAILNQLGDLSYFRNGQVFYPSGRLNAIYSQAPAHVETISGHTVEMGNSITLVPSTYILGITDEIQEFLDINLNI